MEATYTAKKSAWSVVSVFAILFFGIVIPVVFGVLPILLKLMIVDPYYADPVANEGFAGLIETLEGLSASVEEMLAGYGFYKVSSSKLAIIVCLPIAAISFLTTIIVAWIKIRRAKEVAYEFYGKTLVIKGGSILTDGVENRRMFLFPGINVTMKQSLRGKFFRYGDVTISMGMGVAGEVVMKSVKNPRKVVEKVSELAACKSQTAMNLNPMIGMMPWMTMGNPFMM